MRQIKLDADGRHWLVVLPNGVRIGGFETEDDARRFLDGPASALDADALLGLLKAKH